MDVALDANAFLSDPRMEGVAFRSLLDYLRKTQSRLVIPKIVLDEVLARYPERLTAQRKRAVNEVSTLRHLVIDAKIAKIPELDLQEEIRALMKKLRKPDNHVRAVVLTNFSEVSPEEVATRGVQRIPPANGKGEELRDVMSWLMVLAYAKSASREIAFITADAHFRHNDELHPHLAEEVNTRGVLLHFHTAIDEFIKAHAPTPQELLESNAYELYGKTQVLDRFEVEARKYFPNYWPTATAIEVAERDVKLNRGALYRVGPDSEYGEMEFSGQLLLRITTPVFGDFGTTVPMNTLLHVPPQPIVLATEPVQMRTTYKWEVDPVPIDPTPSIVNLWNQKGIRISWGENTSQFKLTGTMVLSVRLVSGRVTQIETERFELGEMVAAA